MKKNNVYLNIVSILLLSFILATCSLQKDVLTTTTTIVDEQSKTYPYFAEEHQKLFSHDTVSDMEIHITQSEWDGLLSDMDANEKTGNYRKVRFVYRGIAGDEILDEVGFRTRGNTTRVRPEDSEGNYHRAHFKLKFDKTFDLVEGTTEYDALNDRRFKKNREINLKWNRGDDATQIRELYSYDFLNRAGVYAPKTGATRLYIKIGDNAKVYFGVYTIIESIDKTFLKKRYGPDANDGNLYKCLYQQVGPSSWGPATLKSSSINSYSIGIKDWKINYRPSYDRQTNDDVLDNYADIKTFSQNITNLSGSALKTYLDANFEVDRFLRWIAANMLLGMPDDYWSMGNNYYLYFNNAGKIEFLPYDYDHGLGGGWDGNVGYNTIMNANIYNWFYNAPGSGYSERPLMKVLDIPEYKATYTNYLKAFIDGTTGIFSFSDFKAKYDKIYALISPYLDNDINEGEYMSLSESPVENYFSAKIASVASQVGAVIITTTTIPSSATTTTNPNTTTTTMPNLGYISPEFTSTDVIFRYRYEGNDPLVIRGSFNGWTFDTTNYSLTDPDNNDIYEITFSKSFVTSGSMYKFYYGVADQGGEWITDPANPLYDPNNSNNSIVSY